MRILSERIIEGNVKYVVISGDSSESKPIEDICDGSVFIESDTGDSYMFNELSGEWVKG